MIRTVSGVLVCGVAVLALVGCGKGETTEGVAPSTQAAPPFDGGGAVVERGAVPGDQTQAGLEATLAARYELARAADWSGFYEYSSDRCQSMYPRAEAVASLAEGYEGRDFSGTPEYLINMNGISVAAVVIKAPDGKSPMTPGTWSYINGSWRDDSC